MLNNQFLFSIFHQNNSTLRPINFLNSMNQYICLIFIIVYYPFNTLLAVGAKLDSLTQVAMQFEMNRQWDSLVQVQWQIGQLYLSEDQINKAEEQYAKVYERFMEQKLANSEGFIQLMADLAEIYYNIGGFEKAKKLYQNALSKQHNYLDKKQKLKLKLLIGLASANCELTVLDSAKSLLKQAQKITQLNKSLKSTFKAQIYLVFANCFVGVNYDSQAYYVQKVEALLPNLEENELSFAKLLNGLGYNYLHLIKTNIAIEYHKRSLELYLKYHPKIKSEIALSYLNLGEALNEQGDFDKSIFYIQKCIDVFESNNIQSYVHAAAYNSLGHIYFKYNLQETAIKNYKKAIEIGTRLFGENYHWVGIFYIYMSYSFNELMNYKKELYCGKKGLEIIQNSLGPNNYWVYEAISSIAYAQIKLGQFQEARANYEKCIQYFKKGNMMLQLSLKYRHYAVLLSEMKENEEALQIEQLALISMCNNFDVQDIFINPSYQGAISKLHFLGLLCDKARIAKRAYDQLNNVDYLALSLDTYLHMLNLVDTMRTNFSTPTTRQQLTGMLIPIYEEGIKAAYLLYNETNDSSLLYTALKLSEKSKANSLSRQMMVNKQLLFEEVPSKISKKEQHLSDTIMALQKKAFKLKGKQKTNVDQQIITNKLVLDSLLKQLKIQYPSYYRAYYDSTRSTNELIKKLLDFSTAYISYFLGPFDQFAIIVTKKQVLVVSLELDNVDFTSLYQLFLPDNSLHHQPENFHNTLAKYSELIWLPVQNQLPEEVKHVIIVPDGPLVQIPFESLLTNTELPQLGTSHLPYLIRKYAVSYAYSMQSLYLQLQRASNRSTKCLAFAPTYGGTSPIEGSLSQFRGSQQLQNLSGTLKEVGHISQFFEGSYFLGQQAQKTTLLNQINQYSIVHMAMHGQFDSTSSLYSRLHFSTTDTSSEHSLFAYEIYNLNLDTDMVVLSACETGKGSLMPGEGAMSLGRAFTHAGCKSTLQSLWKVDDKATSSIMEQFYKGLHDGLSKVQALRAAKLYYLDNSNALTSHPSYWAGFLLHGNYKPLPSYNRFSPIWLWGCICLGVVVMISLMYWIYSRRRAEA